MGSLMGLGLMGSLGAGRLRREGGVAAPMETGATRRGAEKAADEAPFRRAGAISAGMADST
jgi:hypothetical protein